MRMASFKSTLLALLLIAGLLQSARAATYTVGGTAVGWELGIAASFYNDWAKQHSFVAGDVLVFVYAGTEHNVFQVTQTDLNSCTLTKPIKTYTTAGGVSVNLTAGYQGFICGVPGHCLLNMKMNVNVAAAAPLAKAPMKPPTPAPAPSKKPPTPTPAPAAVTVLSPTPAAALGPSASSPEGSESPGPSPPGNEASGLRSAPMVMIVGAVLYTLTTLMFQ